MTTFFQISQRLLNPVVLLTWLHDPLLSMLRINVSISPTLLINIILGKLILSREEHCANVLSFLIPLNAVPTKAEHEARRDFPVCLQGEPHNACSGVALWLLSDLPRLHPSPGSPKQQSFSLQQQRRA